MTPIEIKAGLDIPIDGAPKAEITDVLPVKTVGVYQEFEGLKAKLRVKEGDVVKRGSPLFIDKKQPELHFCAPVAGTVKAIEFGARRALYRILIDVDENGGQESFPSFSADQVQGLKREQVIDVLLQSGLLALIRQRPFSRIARHDVVPKAIFVNGMNTAPFEPDLNVVVRGQEMAFQAGLDALTRLTEGAVHLALAPDASDTLTGVKRVQVHAFSGPHPAGNTSTHIHYIDPMEPTDVVWTIKGVDVIRIGQQLIEGAYPAQCVYSLAGPGVKPEARAYYRAPIGAPLSHVLDGRLIDEETRIIAGSALHGTPLKVDEHVPGFVSALTVLPEGREQFFMGWLAPGINKLSASRAYVSGWTGHKKSWSLTTSLNGSYRSMVLTGLYDKYTPLNIMVDYLVRAVLANDTDEAIQLGILGTDPEDFALCSYACPSKMDIGGVIKQGLDEIEKEGI